MVVSHNIVLPAVFQITSPLSVALYFSISINQNTIDINLVFLVIK